MKNMNMEIAQQEQTDNQQIAKTHKIETKVMKLVVDSYLQGAQTCEVHDGKILGVSIHKEPAIVFIFSSMTTIK